MTYDFKMKDLLDAFGGDPNELADHFMEALQNEVEKQKIEEEQKNNTNISPDDLIKQAVAEMAQIWNDYIHFYLDQKKYGVDPAIYVVNPDFVETLTEIIISMIPFLNSYFSKT